MMCSSLLLLCLFICYIISIISRAFNKIYIFYRMNNALAKIYYKYHNIEQPCMGKNSKNCPLSFRKLLEEKIAAIKYKGKANCIIKLIFTICIFCDGFNDKSKRGGDIQKGYHRRMITKCINLIPEKAESLPAIGRSSGFLGGPHEKQSYR